LRLTTLRTLTAVVAALALLAVGASAASAATATFVNAASPVNTKYAGTLTIAVGASTTSCAVNVTAGQASNSGSPIQGRLSLGYPFGLTCANGGQFGLTFFGNASKDAGVFTINQPAPSGGPIYGGNNPFAAYNYPTSFWTLTAWSAPATWTNGNATTPSKITFNNTTIGTHAGAPIRATGNLNVTRTNNALLTLQ
jgi:hypothetical protein